MKSFSIIFIIIIVIFFLIFSMSILLILSPKLRAKMMHRQVKALREMTDMSKDDFSKIQENVAMSIIDAKKNVLDQKETVLEDISTREAKIKKDAITIKTKAFIDGVKGEMDYCKYCGKSIDKDSIYCSNCGKKVGK